MQTLRPKLRSILLAAAFTMTGATAQAQEKLTFNLGWLSQGSTIGPLAAVAGPTRGGAPSFVACPGC